VLAQLAEYGRADLVARRSGTLPVSLWDWWGWDDFSNAYTAISQNESLFSQYIAEVYAAAGGEPYAMYGGYEVLRDYTASSTDPKFLEMMDVTISFKAKLGSGHLNFYEVERRSRTNGS